MSVLTSASAAVVPRLKVTQLSPWTGFAVLCRYAVVLIAAAAWRLGCDDA